MKINKCPRCGREPEVIVLMDADYDVEGYIFGCHYCDLYPDRCATESEAVTKWNELTNNLVTKN